MFYFSFFIYLFILLLFLYTLYYKNTLRHLKLKKHNCCTTVAQQLYNSCTTVVQQLYNSCATVAWICFYGFVLSDLVRFFSGFVVYRVVFLFCFIWFFCLFLSLGFSINLLSEDYSYYCRYDLAFINDNSY